MSAISDIKKIIEGISEGELFSAKAFRHVASSDNIKQVLSRLVKEGVIKRSARGVYVKPKKIKDIGVVAPSAREIAKTLAESTGETLIPHGAEAARQLQLTTQVPMRLIFYTNGSSRVLNISNQTVELKHASPNKLSAAKTMTGLAISALLYLGKNNVTNDVIDKLKSQLTKSDFQNLLKEVENLPAWLANTFYHYQKGKK